MEDKLGHIDTFLNSCHLSFRPCIDDVRRNQLAIILMNNAVGINVALKAVALFFMSDTICEQPFQFCKSVVKMRKNVTLVKIRRYWERRN